jgi:hypothetical protein
VLAALEDCVALMQMIAEVLAPPDPQAHERGAVLLVIDGKTLLCVRPITPSAP